MIIAGRDLQQFLRILHIKRPHGDGAEMGDHAIVAQRGLPVEPHDVAQARDHEFEPPHAHLLHAL